MTATITSVARVATDRPSRYGKQLANHLNRRARGEWDEASETGTVAFGDADAGDVATLACEPGTLVLTLTASPGTVDRLEDVLGRHLVRFGSRHELVARWTRSDGSLGTTQRADADEEPPRG